MFISRSKKKAEKDRRLQEAAKAKDERRLQEVAKAENERKLQEAAENGDSAQLSEILTQGNVDVNCKDEAGQLPVHLAAWSGSIECLDVLIKHGSLINTQSEDGVLPIHLAAQEGSLECLDSLIKHGSHINAQSNEGLLPIHLAAGYGSFECLDVLIKHGSHINTQDEEGFLPIHAAAVEGKVDCLDILIKHGAHINAQSNGGATPLHTSAYYGKLAAARCLIENDCDPTIKNVEGRTAYEVAVEECENEVASLIKQYQDKIEEKGMSAELRLMRRCEAADLDSVEEILEQPVDVNYIGKFGNSALHLASKAGSEQIVEILLARGSDPTLENHDGDRPEDVARIHGHMKIRNSIRKFQADAAALAVANLHVKEESQPACQEDPVTETSVVTVKAKPLDVGKVYLCKFEEDKRKFKYENFILEPAAGVSVKKSRVLKIWPPDKAYQTNSKQRGMAFICCNTNFDDVKMRRDGSDIDENIILTLFTQMGIMCYLHRDMTKYQTYLTLQKFAQRDEMAKIDVLIVYFMTHGSFGNLICTDGKKYKVEDIFKVFDDEHCPPLRNIPKMHVEQACRGFADAEYYKDNLSEAQMQKEIRKKAAEMFQQNFDKKFKYEMQETVIGSENLTDVLVCYSVMAGYASLRNKIEQPSTEESSTDKEEDKPEPVVRKGSPFVEAFARNFCEHAHDTDLRTLLSKVCREITTNIPGTKATQPGEVVDRSFSKMCYLNPGIWGESPDEN